MILGIGVDIVSHEQTKLLEWETCVDELEIFSDEEILIYNAHKRIKFLTGRFAAKEAVLKCLGTGMEDGISLKDIVVLQMENEKPCIELKGEVKYLSESKGINLWHISISHTEENSIAFVIAEKVG